MNKREIGAPISRAQYFAARIGPIAFIAFTVLVLLAAASELLARRLFSESSSSAMKCLVVTDPRTGVRGIPGSFCQQKIPESPLVDYRFNDCGYRTPQPCRRAAPGVYRIVLIGSSMNYGMNVAQSQSFAALLGPMLSDRLKRPVDLFNESMQWGSPASWALRANTILKPDPDLILWVLTPLDIQNPSLILPYISGVQDQIYEPSKPRSAAPQPAISGIAAPPSPGIWAIVPRAEWHRVIGFLLRTRTVLVLQHYLYSDQDQYLSHTLADTAGTDYLQVPAPATLPDELARFADDFGRVAARAKAAGVPLVVTLLPSRPQAIMLLRHSWGKNYDPSQLDRMLRRIVESGGAHYVDMTTGLDAMADAGQGFLPLDGHLNPQGHRIFSTLLANALVRSGTLTGTARDRHQPSAMEAKRR